MGRARYLGLGASCLALAATGFAAGPPLREHLGSRGASILRGATRVEILRVKAIPYSEPAPRPYEIVRAGPTRDAKFAARLADVLLGDGVTVGASRCPFSPGVAFRAYQGEQAVEVVVCFHCEDLMAGIVGTGKPGRWPYPRYRFGPARAALVRLAKEAFPEDPKIRDLPEQRKE
jgi:hypothetical protein